jgi:hypothetical protein
MSKSPQGDSLAEAKRIMERLVKMPHKLHKDEPSKKGRRPSAGRRKAK